MMLTLLLTENPLSAVNAQRLAGLSQSTLIRARKKPDTLLVVTDSGPPRYLRSSVEAFNEARMLRRSRFST